MNKKILLGFAFCWFLVNGHPVDLFNEADDSALLEHRSKRGVVVMLKVPDPVTCNVAISTAGNVGDTSLNFNFVTIGDDCNPNVESLEGNDSTKERVDGGRLKHITVRAVGKFCLEYLGIRCGSSVTGRGDKSIILSHESFPSYHCMMHKWWRDPACVWFSSDKENVQKFYINEDIFDCGEKDYNCHKGHIGSQINGCVDMTGGKFVGNDCS